MLWQIFQKIEPTLVKLYRKVSQPPVPNLKGDRDIEYSWVAVNMPEGPGEALDFGCGAGWLGLLAARRGFNVTAVDLEYVTWFYNHPKLKFVQGDILKLNLPTNRFDLIINCSTIEHVGLAGRYRVSESNPDGDIAAMAILRSLLKKGKKMLLTIPVGRDKIFPPLHRVYGRKRLPKLLEGYHIIKKEYWVKEKNNKWIMVDENEALSVQPKRNYYGLGCFVLEK